MKRALIIRTIKELFTLKVRIGSGSQGPCREVPDSELTDAKFVWVEGIPDELFVGELRRLADITGARPQRRPGYWLLKEGVAYPGPQARPGEKTVLHLHGGAFYVSRPVATHLRPLLCIGGRSPPRGRAPWQDEWSKMEVRVW